MIYVYRLPEKMSDGYCFGDDKLIQFQNVDWFNSPSETMGFGEMTLADMREFIEGKNYARSGDSLLVVDTVDDFTMLIHVNGDNHD